MLLHCYWPVQGTICTVLAKRGEEGKASIFITISDRPLPVSDFPSDMIFSVPLLSVSTLKKTMVRLHLLRGQMGEIDTGTIQQISGKV